MIKVYETMFPRSLIVAMGNTSISKIFNRFDVYFTNNEDIKIDIGEFRKCALDKDIVASIYYINGKKDDDITGYLVYINLLKSFDIGTCAHEATHICQLMEEYFGLESSASEYRAYTTEYYTNKLLEFKNNMDKKYNK